jgi:thiamine kinase-like enzyme
VPSAEAGITPAWLEAAIGSELGPFRSIETEPVGEGFGLSSRIWRCRRGGPELPRSVVVKLWSTEGPAGIREVSFYRTFGNRAGARVPACHHADIDEKAKRGVLVLEDIAGAAQGDCLERLDRPRALAVARELAGLHAAWSSRPEVDGAGWIPEAPRLREPEWIEDRRARFLARWGDRLDTAERRLVENAERAQVRAAKRLAGAATTLLHADLHLDNVLFEADSGRPVLLDWARVARGPAALDVARLLFTIARPEDEGEILAGYLEALRSRGVVADETALRRELGGALLLLVTTSTLGIVRWEPASERETAMIEVGVERARAAVARWRETEPELFRF